MFADPGEGQDMQCDSPSSSSSGSESPQHETASKESFLSPTLSELHINDDKKLNEQTTISALALPTSSSSSDLDVRNEGNLPVLQSSGSQDQTSSQVQMTGGEFVGATFGPQTAQLKHLEFKKHAMVREALSKLKIEEDKSLALALPTSSSSSDLDVRNEENLPVLQGPGSQNQTSSQVQITGCVGTHFGPLTTRQHLNLDQLDHSQQIHVHYHYHYHSASSSEEGTSSEEPVGADGYTKDQHQAVTEEPSTSSEEVALCSSIKLFPKRRISDNVFRGEQTRKLTGTRELAIKFLQYKEDKLREAKILTQLHPHHNVVSILHSDIYKLGVVEQIYIAMELCHEQNLQDHIISNNNNNVSFDPQLSISQAKQLIEGMKHIHSNEIIHRDLKPSNILFSPDKITLKIVDFGISKEMTSGRTVTDVTNARAGTDGYRAPETYNSNEISKQTDIFSLGLVFYFLWSNGQHPYGDDSDEWNSNIKRNRDRDLSHLLLPDKETAIDLLEWMLRFNPRERPTVSQILMHQMFGGTEKEIKPSTSKRGGNPEGIKWIKKRRHVGSKVGINVERKLLKESQLHVKNEDYSLASEALEHLLTYQPDPWIRFETIQQLAECHIMSNVPIHEDIKKFLSICESLPWWSTRMEIRADDHFEHSRLVRAYFLYVCASKWHKTHSSTRDAVGAIERCIEKIREVVDMEEEQVGSHGILSNYVQSGMKEMLEDRASCYLSLNYEKPRSYLMQSISKMA